MLGQWVFGPVARAGAAASHDSPIAMIDIATTGLLAIATTSRRRLLAGAQLVWDGPHHPTGASPPRHRRAPQVRISRSLRAGGGRGAGAGDVGSEDTGGTGPGCPPRVCRRMRHPGVTAAFSPQLCTGEGGAGIGRDWARPWAHDNWLDCPALPYMMGATRRVGGAMAEQLRVVCDVCGDPAAATVGIRVGGRTLSKDLCTTHLSELTAGARAARRGRPRKVSLSP